MPRKVEEILISVLKYRKHLPSDQKWKRCLVLALLLKIQNVVVTVIMQRKET